MFGLSLTFSGVTANYTENGEVLAMAAITFDTLGYFQKLKAAGVPEEQAQSQADALRLQSEAQAAALQKALDKYDAVSRKDLATKGDIQDVRGEILRLENKIEANKHEILKWVIGTMVAQTALIVAVIGVAIALVVK